jgi:hypothetical protein
MCCSPGSDCFEWVKTIAPVIVTVIFGAIAGAITWRQYQVAKAKLKLDLFEKRYAIFHKVWEICSQTFAYGARDVKSFGQFSMTTPFNEFRPEAAFLFGKKIEAYIDELSKHWAQLRAHEGLNEVDTAINAEKAAALQNYFLDQANSGVKDRFSPFLDFANWK